MLFDGGGGGGMASIIAGEFCKVGWDSESVATSMSVHVDVKSQVLSLHEGLLSR
jgi:hypothetical protein